MIGWPAAIANALANALGIRFTKLPLKPDYILDEIKKKRPDLIKKLEEGLKVGG